jgi:lipopolysaccharide/colanic/teichoic acid biosynthesis glycosyltransferase/CheY-like chemotaxis protein
MKEILVTDDDLDTSHLIKKLLSDTQFQVIISASSSNDALDKIKIHHPDVVILNKTLDKRVNGENASNYISKQYSIPIIYLNNNGKATPNELSSSASEFIELHKPIEKSDLLNALNSFDDKERLDRKITSSKLDLLTDNIISEFGEPAYNFIQKYTDLSDDKTIVVSTSSRFNIKIYPVNIYHSLTNLKKINDIKHLNKFFETANDVLIQNGIFIGCAETKGLRKKRILKKYPPFFNYIYYTLDFILKRVFPKLPITKNIYFFITKGRNRVLSRPEILGRLCSCGFEVIDEQFISNLLYFAVRKIKKPYYDLHPSYGLVVKLDRIGKNGKSIGVYKFRTMHPYSEYLHDYILKQNGYADIGKPAGDFRVTTWGKFIRRYWLDELPQLINIFKGDMKLVGVRPISKRVYEDYPRDIKKLRAKHKPGCFPPYVALLMQNMEDSIKAERIYLLEKEKHPYTTDIKYFFKSVYNILTNKIRSA